MSGKLYLIPTPLTVMDDTSMIPASTIEVVRNVEFFIAERAKTARQFIKACQHPKSLQEISVVELDKHNKYSFDSSFLDPLIQGHDMGLLSEAGCPGVADPGAGVVEAAHRKNIEVIPLSGPSSLLLALMASGLNGQNFTFAGYPPIEKDGLKNTIQQYEKISSKNNTTYIFIETPYRNNAFTKSLVELLHHETLLCVAANIGAKDQYIATKTIKNWNKEKLPELHKIPTVFLFLAK